MDDLHFRLARAGEGPRLRPLWQECFGVTQDFWEVYETFAFSPGQVELGFWEEILCSRMTLLPGTLWTKTGTAKKAACIYGLATLPLYQGRGAATALLKRAVERLESGEMDCLAVVPDTPELYPFYARALGAKTAFYIRFARKERQDLPSVSTFPRPIGAEGYADLRQRALAGRNFMDWRGRLLEFQRRISQGEDGGMFSFPQAPQCCAAAEIDEAGHLQVRELLGPEEDLEGCLAGLMDALGCKRAQVRLPPWSKALGGEKEPFAMAAGLPVSAGEEWYLGFDFA